MISLRKSVPAGVKARPLSSSNCENGNDFKVSSSHTRVDARTSRAAVPRTRTRTTDWFFRPLSAANVVWRFCRAAVCLQEIEIKGLPAHCRYGNFLDCWLRSPTTISTARPRRNRAGRRHPAPACRASAFARCLPTANCGQCPMQKKIEFAPALLRSWQSENRCPRGDFGMSGLPCVTPTLILSSGNCVASSTSFEAWVNRGFFLHEVAMQE